MTLAAVVPDAAVETRPQWRPRRVTGLAFVGFLLIGLAWMLSSPLYAGPDEPDHVAKAASVVRGEWQGFNAPDENGLPSGAVRAPFGAVSPRRWELCFAHRPEVSAACQRLHRESGRMVVAPSGAARYYPPYYVVDGLPSLASPSPDGVYLMRVLSLAACAALAATAIGTMTVFASPVALAGAFVAVTPMVLFVSSVVNPNGIEIAGGIAAWAAGVALVRGAGGEAVTGRLVRRFGVAGLAMLLVRATAPMWLLLTVLLLAVGAGWPRIRAVARRRDAQVWAGVLTLAAIANGVWSLGPGALDPVPNPPHVSFASALNESFYRWHWRNDQLIGVFGWLDVKPPQATYWIWVLALIALAVAAVARMSWRWRAVFVGVVVIATLLPVLLESAQAARYGFPWQGRYTLPFAVGVPLVAGACAARPVARAGRRWRLVATVALVVTLGVGQMLALVANTLRYEYGVGGSLDVFSGQWQPPGGAWLLLGLGAAGCLAFVAAAAVAERRFGSVDAVSVST